MRRIITAFLFLLLLLPVLLPGVAIGATQWQWGQPQWVRQCVIGYNLQAIHPQCASGQTVNVDQYGICCAFNAIYLVTGWIFWFIIAIVILLIVIGAFLILTSAGAPEKVGKGKTLIIWAVVGFLVALIARAVPYVAGTMMGFTGLPVLAW